MVDVGSHQTMRRSVSHFFESRMAALDRRMAILDRRRQRNRRPQRAGSRLIADRPVVTVAPDGN
jgi:hypothetical protein